MVWYAVLFSGLGWLFCGLLYFVVRRSLEQEVDSLLRPQASALAEVIVPAGPDTFYVELSSEQVEYFGDEGLGAFHYAIWESGGERIDFSHPSLPIPAPQAPGVRNRGPYRELIMRGPGDSWILVGKDMQREQLQLRNLTAIGAGVGLLALVLMLAGGWFFIGRALAPVERITHAAANISASNLSERIDVSRMETELAALAETINDAFDRLQQAFEQQARFTADASHELRTPLSIVHAHAELALKRERRSEAEYRETLATIHHASRRMKGVVEGLLVLARADAGAVELSLAKLALDQLVKEVCTSFMPMARERQIELTVHSEPVTVLGDKQRLEGALANLVGNAIQYNVDRGRIEVVLRREIQHAVVRVTNTGIGIADADLPHVFERFYRADKARSSSGGNGLGLAIAKWVVEAHGGEIFCESGDPQRTTFTLRLGNVK